MQFEKLKAAVEAVDAMDLVATQIEDLCKNKETETLRLIEYELSLSIERERKRGDSFKLPTYILLKHRVQNALTEAEGR